jgi:hypothetical protein
MTRRSRVQIPPPLPRALASVLLARASTVLCGSSTGPSTGGSGWFLLDELFEGTCGFRLHAGEHVLVGIDGERGVSVTEPLGHHLDGHSGFDQQCAVGVPDVVETDARHAGSVGDPFEGLGDRMRMNGFAVGIGEYPTFRFDGDGLLFCFLPLAPCF